MAGHPFRADDVVFNTESFSKSHRERPADLRRFLLRLALDSHSPEEVLRQACSAIREVTHCSCSFIEGDGNFGPAPGFVAVPVVSDGLAIGALVIRNGVEMNGLNRRDMEEIAELVGIAIMNARQSQAVVELQSDSEDMLFHAPDAIFVLSQSGTVQMANRRFLEFIGLPSEQIIGKPIAAVFDPGPVDRDVLSSYARAAESFEIEASASTGRRLVSLIPSFVGDESTGKILCILRDITAERQSQLAIRRTERSLLMGKAVEYLLHEVNNPLAALISNLSRAAKVIKEIPKSTDSANTLQLSLSHATDAAERIRETMSQLRAAHIGEHRNLETLVDIGHEISLAISGLDLPEGSHAVVIEREIQIQDKILTTPLVIAEAVNALVRNSLEALENMQRGVIRIAARETEGALFISVEDNGPGIPSHLVNQIFMPFFTTKPLGRSLGLGLTMVDDALRRLKGAIRIVPSDNGACFEMMIPKSPVIKERIAT
jgi:PAS domain S-box-containing protein